MNELAHDVHAVVHGDDLCIRDPGGEDRATIATTEADHSPPEDPDGIDRMLAPVADALLGAAALQRGERVLDIGCGAGATALLAAEAVGRDGRVDGVDITREMLDIAAARAATHGRTNVGFVDADAQRDDLPGPVDVAISRFGTMFFDDPVAAFRNIRHALAPQGRLCLATWQPLDANAWLVVPGAALLHWIELPETSGAGPGMFSQSDPAVIETTLTDAGYHDVTIQPVKLALPLGEDPDAALARLHDTGVGRAALDAVPGEALPDAEAAVRAALCEHQGPEGVRLGAAVLITTAIARD
jgi:SAM-dependent methyltransferase